MRELKTPLNDPKLKFKSWSSSSFVVGRQFQGGSRTRRRAVCSPEIRARRTWSLLEQTDDDRTIGSKSRPYLRKVRTGILIDLRKYLTTRISARVLYAFLLRSYDCRTFDYRRHAISSGRRIARGGFSRHMTVGATVAGSNSLYPRVHIGKLLIKWYLSQLCAC